MKYDNDSHIFPVIAPVDTTSTTVNTDVVHAGQSLSPITFGIQFGVITGDEIVVTVEECDDITPSNTTAIAFDYRLTSAVNTDAVGAKTAATTAGATIAAGDDNKMLLVYVDTHALSAGRDYVRCVCNPGASASVALISAFVVLNPMYARKTITSQVD